MNTVWIVESDLVKSVFKNEKRAKALYEREVKRLMEHKPNASDLWSYTLLGRYEDDNHCAIFEAKWGMQERDIIVSYAEYPIRDA